MMHVAADNNDCSDFGTGTAKAGEKAGVPTPLNSALWALMKGLEHSWQDPD